MSTFQTIKEEHQKYINRDTKVKNDYKSNPPMPKGYGELKTINHPKYIIFNGALYEKIDGSVLTVANGYGDLV